MTRKEARQIQTNRNAMRVFTKLLSAVGLTLLLVTSVVAETISPSAATQHVGSVTTAEGVVSQVSTSNGGTTFINFGGRYPNHVFYAVIFKNVAVRFPGVYGLEGKTVAISGPIELYKGKPQIILKSPSQLVVR